jgi:hypothetical protein
MVSYRAAYSGSSCRDQAIRAGLLNTTRRVIIRIECLIRNIYKRIGKDKLVESDNQEIDEITHIHSFKICVLSQHYFSFYPSEPTDAELISQIPPTRCAVCSCAVVQ